MFFAVLSTGSKCTILYTGPPVRTIQWDTLLVSAASTLLVRDDNIFCSVELATRGNGDATARAVGSVVVIT